MKFPKFSRALFFKAPPAAASVMPHSFHGFLSAKHSSVTSPVLWNTSRYVLIIMAKCTQTNESILRKEKIFLEKNLCKSYNFNKNFDFFYHQRRQTLLAFKHVIKQLIFKLPKKNEYLRPGNTQKISTNFNPRTALLVPSEILFGLCSAG